MTVDRVLRALVGQLIGEQRSHDEIAKLFGADRTQITKVVGKSSGERRVITMDHLRKFAETYPGGARALFARLDGIARKMPDSGLTDDETRTSGVRRGRPPVVSGRRSLPVDVVEELGNEMERRELGQSSDVSKTKRAGKKQ